MHKTIHLMVDKFAKFRNFFDFQILRHCILKFSDLSTVCYPIIGQKCGLAMGQSNRRIYNRIWTYDTFKTTLDSLFRGLH